MKHLVIDPVMTEMALANVVKYMFTAELKSFEETFANDTFESLDLDNIKFSDNDEVLEIVTEGGIEQIKNAIKTIESIKCGENHIFYSVLILISAYGQFE